MHSIESMDAPNRRERLMACFKDGKITEQIRGLPDHLKLMTDGEFRKQFRVTPTEFAVKKRLWQLFLERESALDPRITMVEIYDGVTSREYFYQIIRDPPRLAWLMCPPHSAEELIEETFYFLQDKIRQALEDIKITEKNLPIFMKFYQITGDRHLGAPTQNINTKNVDLQIRMGGQALPSEPEALHKQLEDVKRQLNGVRDVAPVDGED